MKIKDLLKFNPEAEVIIVLKDGIPYKGELDLGWNNGLGDIFEEDNENSEIFCTEVYIHLNSKEV